VSTHAEPAPRERCPRCGERRTRFVLVRYPRSIDEQGFWWCDDCYRSFVPEPLPAHTTAERLAEWNDAHAC